MIAQREGRAVTRVMKYAIKQFVGGVPWYRADQIG